MLEPVEARVPIPKDRKQKGGIAVCFLVDLKWESMALNCFCQVGCGGNEDLEWRRRRLQLPTGRQ